MTVSSNPLLQAALSYAARGWAVFPLHSISNTVWRCTCGNQNCASPGKHPRTEHGLKDATTKAETISAWWDQWPGANVAITTGAVSGIVVIDVDPRNSGDVSLLELEREHGELPYTLRSHTGGGGEHLVFSHAGSLCGGQHKLAPGLDLKAEGGYVVAPPSLHLSGERYKWESYDAQISPLPEWIIQRCTPTKRTSDAAERAHSLTMAEASRASAVLERIPADDYDTWLKVGMALHHADLGGPLGFSLWDAWSRKSEGKYSPGAIEAKWSSFSADREPVVTLGTIFSLAGPESSGEIPWPGDGEAPLGRDSIIESSVLPPPSSAGRNVWHPITTAFSNIEERLVSWLWYPYFPLGRITILEGDPGQGKTWFSLAVAAQLSLGLWPFYINGGGESVAAPANTIYVTTEDDPSDTIKKRIGILGADQGRVHFLHGKAREHDSAIMPLTLDDIAILDEAISGLEARLIIIDPIQAYLPARIDMNRAESVRSVLAALHILAHLRGCAVLLIRHLSKSAKERVIYRGMGSIDFAAAARSVLVCGEVEGEERGLSFQRKFAVIQTKNNLAPRGLAIEFELRPDEFCWIGGTNRTIDSILSPFHNTYVQGSVEEVKNFFLEVLADGPVLAESVRRQARQLGLDPKSLIEAKVALKIKNDKLETGWAWKLPV